MNKNELKKMMEDQVKMIMEQQAALMEKINITEPIRICIDDIGCANESVLEEIKEFKNESVVYLIMLKNGRSLSIKPESIKELFDEIRANKDKGNWLVSAVNVSNWETDSRCLYVGSSRDIMKRIKEHLAVGSSPSRKTYSLWLKDWFGKSGLPQEIEIYFLSFKGLSHTETYMIEDLLWRGFSPLFGRSGKSPKSKK